MTDQISFPPLLELSPDEIHAQKQRLLSEITRDKTRFRVLRLGASPLFRRVSRPRWAMIAVAAAAVAGVGINSLSQSAGHQPSRSGGEHGKHTVTGGILGVGVPIGSISAAVADPLPGATQIPLAQASSTLGAPVVLPNTNLVSPSDAGPVWTRTIPNRTQVAVTFPAQNLILYYGSPGYSLATWERIDPYGTVVTIQGVQAVYFDQKTSDGGANALILTTKETDILIAGRYDEQTLESVAQSVLSQSG